MDADELKEEIQHQQELIKGYRKRQRVLEQQASVFGLHVPPHIQIEIDDLQEKIYECEDMIAKLNGNNVTIRYISPSMSFTQRQSTNSILSTSAPMKWGCVIPVMLLSICYFIFLTQSPSRVLEIIVFILLINSIGLVIINWMKWFSTKLRKRK
jgi:hypothetical protein